MLESTFTLEATPAGSSGLQPIRGRRSAAGAGVLVLGLVLVGTVAPVLGQSSGDYEEATPLSASELLPSELLSGPHHRVDETVTTIGFLDHYTIHSDFGEFEASSDRMLRVRVSEIAAIAELKELSRTDAFSGALKSSANGTVDTVTQVVTQPVETAKGVPEGVSRRVRGLYYKGRKYAHKAGEAIDEQREERASEVGESSAAGEADDQQGSPEAKEVAVSAAKNFSGYNSAKRELAKRLGVDPYSTNPVLQKELDRLSQAAFGANLTFRAVVPRSSALGYIGRVQDLVWDTPPDELERLNNATLADLGLEKSLRLDFFEVPAFTPTTQTLLVESLRLMAGVRDLGTFLEIAVSLEHEQDAWLLTTAAGILASYHEQIRPLRRLAQVGNDDVGFVPLGVNDVGSAIVPVPFDRLTWTAAIDVRGPLDAYEKRELWLSGRVSTRARGELEARDFEVNDNVVEFFERKE